MNRHNWFPFTTFIVGLPGETEDDTKKSLDLLHALKDAKWVAIPTLFVPFEETRMGANESAKLAKLTELQWEFFFTCWRYNLDFYRNDPGFPSPFQSRRADLLLRDGTQIFRQTNEISVNASGAFSRKYSATPSLFGFTQTEQILSAGNGRNPTTENASGNSRTG